MGKITADSGKTYPKPEQGQHDVMLVQVVDLGTQPSKDPQYEPSRQLELMFEVMDQTHEFEKDGEKTVKPFAVWTYTSPYISYKKDKVTNYHKLVNALSGKSLTHEEAKNIDFSSFLGQIYTATIVYKGEYVNIQEFTKVSAKLLEAYKDYQSHNEQFVFSLEEFDVNIFAKLNEKKQNKIAQSPEYQKATQDELF